MSPESLCSARFCKSKLYKWYTHNETSLRVKNREIELTDEEMPHKSGNFTL